MENKVSDEYPLIYHYTTTDGLLGILKSKKLWATNYKALSDSQEIRFFGGWFRSNVLNDSYIDEIEKICKERSDIKEHAESVGGIRKFATDEAKSIVNIFYKGLLGDAKKLPLCEPYIASFCAVNAADHYVQMNGLLSQWRGYGRDGGYAVAFDSKLIEEMLMREAKAFAYTRVALSDVVYDEEHKSFKHFKADIDSLKNLALMYLSSPDRHPQKADVDEIFAPFLNCITRFKHHSFKEENEVRAILFPLDQSHKEDYEKQAKQKFVEKEILFRSKGSGVLPYIELLRDVSEAIKTIIVGPHPNKLRRAAQLKSIVKDGIEIRVSETPYLGN